MKSKIKNYKIWFFSEQPLEVIGKMLFEKGVIGQFEYDYENIYEWIEAESNNLLIELNFSRKHIFWEDHEENSIEQFEANKKEPISVLLMYDEIEPSDEQVNRLANAFHLTFNESVFVGTINHLGTDD